jgi:hypothetical protein
MMTVTIGSVFETVIVQRTYDKEWRPLRAGETASERIITSDKVVIRLGMMLRDDVVEWFDEHIHNGWTITCRCGNFSIEFVNENDAILFSLMWL